MTIELIKLENTKAERIKGLITEKGKITKEVMNYYNSQKGFMKLLKALLMTSKIRRNELMSIKRIEQRKGILYVVVEPLKDSKAKREIAKIEPFYTFILENKNKTKWIKEIRETLFRNKNDVVDFFSSLKTYYNNDKICARSFEYFTMTYMNFLGKGKTALSKISGHKGVKNVDSYTVSMNMNPETLKDNLDSTTKHLGNLLISTTNTTLEALKYIESESLLPIKQIKDDIQVLQDNQEALNNKMDLIISLLKND